MPYSCQLFINILTGTNDATITIGTTRIAAKQQTSPVQNSIRLYPKFPNVPGDGPHIAQDIAAATRPWRLYIRGHGNFQQRRVGGVDGPTLAAALAGWGLASNLPGIISVTGCKAAKGAGEAANAVSLTISTNSFAAEFHRALGLSHGIFADVYGRTMNVNTGGATGVGSGSKMTRNPVTGQLHRSQAFSKVRYYWSGQTQMAEWVNYVESMDIDDPMDVDETPEPMDVG